MRLNERLTRPFQAPASIQRYPGSQVALFRNGQSDLEDSSEEELDVMELRARGREQQRSNAGRTKAGDVMLLEREVAEDDSLNKLALQYGCKVADIKRINNFIREQDLYALKSIKIPIKVNGILTETSETSLAPQSSGLSPTELPGSPGTGSLSADGKQIDRYFRGIDQNIEQAAQVEASFSSDYCVETPDWSPPKPKKPSSGADCGIQWWNAVIVMLLVGIVLPVFYIVYFKTQASGVAAHATNTTVPVSNSSRGSVAGVLVSVSGAGHPPTPHAPKTKAAILSGE
ncbi:lysM and putative peptidoglycan-binding domain-containing protein 4 [Heteronotia binoei]|uniref:lysM and putative peptidoglycan-binding domain-containing protein 4 n=1 Tax=Heteronotia binoei TaxID=13085 RepID=UPI0029303BA2|nr:lysM and putative peptidoglycan-binding domain-containing protein 4 [Heteronotia binoei]XP_060115866.1 lysM and putative peptidoglycan-binding domain-containing protein 4 [Heteronotia binoei]XP_060115867.1 lysM and putative peptidoglycan-binding domain-containing protein 4 [Heteronotia binoei]